MMILPKHFDDENVEKQLEHFHLGAQQPNSLSALTPQRRDSMHTQPKVICISVKYNTKCEQRNLVHLNFELRTFVYINLE